MTYDELVKEVEADLAIEKTQLDRESSRTPILHNKYLKELIIAKTKHEEMKSKLVSFRRSKWIYYSGKATAEVYKEKPFDFKVMKSDLKMFIDSDQEILDRLVEISFLERKIEFLVNTLGEIQRRTFHISNMIKFLKFKQGEV